MDCFLVDVFGIYQVHGVNMVEPRGLKQTVQLSSTTVSIWNKHVMSIIHQTVSLFVVDYTHVPVCELQGGHSGAERKQ